MATIAPTYEYYGECTRVIDGDTIEVHLDLGLRVYTTIRVRLLGVDAPEIFSGTPEERKKGNIVKEYVRSMLEDRYVKIVTVKDSTSFNRYLATVWFDTGLKELLNANELITSYITQIIK